MGGRGLKLVVSDFHLGKGPYRDDGSVNVFEDFRQDGKFAEFLDYHCEGEWKDEEVELVANGDFFNLLSVDLDGRMQEAITERLAVEKTEAILRGHPLVFDALARFAQRRDRSVTFLMGNHDPGLLFAGVRGAITRRVGGAHRFILDGYDFDGVHIEHGMQREPMNAFNPARYFREKDGEVFLNLPLGSRYIIHVLNEEKAQRPYIDKVAPTRIGKYATVAIALTVVVALAGDFGAYPSGDLGPFLIAFALLAAECVAISFAQYFLFFVRAIRDPAR